MKNPLAVVVLLVALLVTLSSCSSNTSAPELTALPEMVVYKSPTCGCCQEWVKYIERAGYPVTAIDTDDMDSIKAENGLHNPALHSCHTAVVDGYVIEGHVPLSDIERLLAERPDVAGLTAPGMPMMSPGMGSETPKDYDVLEFDKDGNSRVYSSY